MQGEQSSDQDKNIWLCYIKIEALLNLITGGLFMVVQPKWLFWLPKGILVHMANPSIVILQYVAINMVITCTQLSLKSYTMFRCLAKAHLHWNEYVSRCVLLVIIQPVKKMQDLVVLSFRKLITGVNNWTMTDL